MKNLSKYTKTLMRKKRICGILSWLCTFGPIIFFGSLAFMEGVEVGDKAAVDLTFLIIMTGLAAIFTLIGLLRKYIYRSIPYFIILGVFFILDTIVPLIITIAVCTIIDELIMTPLYERYKNLTQINKEIDRRGTI